MLTVTTPEAEMFAVGAEPEEYDGTEPIEKNISQ
jgi:hypothetical protein